MGKKLTSINFIKMSKKIHSDKYDYSLVNYINNRTKVKIICPEHGVFEQLPSAHLRGQKCKKCTINNKNVESFISESNNIHKNKYNYSLVNYKNNKTKIKIICPEHGVFEQRPDSHIRGMGCNKCGIIYKKNKLKNNNFIKKSKDVHGDKYDYSLVNYINNRTKVKIICPEHGVFEQSPYHHISGLGCNICKMSKGEIIIKNYLIKKNIKFIKEKTFNNCRNVNKLRFDFYLTEYNTCIEYDGSQHFQIVQYWGGKKGLKDRIKKDNIKNRFCKTNNINLLRIKYNENILNKLDNYIKKQKI